MSTGSNPSEPTVPRRPVLVGLYHVVPLDDDRLQIANAGRAILLKGKGFGRRVTPLLAALDGSATVDELVDRFPELALDVLRALAGHGLLTDGVAASDTAAGSRLAAEVFATERSTADTTRLLSQATVAVSGDGPTTGTAAVLLAKAGVGKLLVRSSGTVTARDLALSPVLRAADEGRSRAGAVADLCGGSVVNGIDPGALEEAALPGALIVAVVESSYVSDTETRGEADQLLDAGIPYVLHSQDALEATVGPVVGVGGIPCHRCLEVRKFSHQANPEEHLAYRRHRAQVAPGPDAFVAAHGSLLAGMLAAEVLRAVILPSQRRVSSVVVVDLATTEVRREELLPVPGCAGCGEAALHRRIDSIERSVTPVNGEPR